MHITIERYCGMSDISVLEELWKAYQQAFQGAVTGSVQDQICYSRQSFFEAMRDSEHHVFVARDQDGLVLGFALGTTNMEKASIAYVNPRFLQKKFPEDYAEGRLLYFTALAVLPQFQGQGAMEAIVEDVTKFNNDLNGVILFDHSSTVPDLPHAFEQTMVATQKRHGLSTLGTKYEFLGGQSYAAIRFLPRP